MAKRSGGRSSGRKVIGKKRGKCRIGKNPKTRYRSREEAEWELNRIWSLPSAAHRMRIPRSVYECTYCGGWHLTSMEQEKPARERLVP